MKVYVITAGVYSDYHICCVCIDRETAERRKKLFSDKYDEAEIEEFDSDECQEFTKNEDGEIVRTDGKKLYTVDIFDSGEVNAWETRMSRPHREKCWYSDEYEKWVAVVYGQDEKEAKKRAFDLIANKKWEMVEGAETCD